MIIAVPACIVILILAIFCYRTMDLDIMASLIVAVIGTGALGLVIAGAVYAGQLF